MKQEYLEAIQLRLAKILKGNLTSSCSPDTPYTWMEMIEFMDEFKDILKEHYEKD